MSRWRRLLPRDYLREGDPSLAIDPGQGPLAMCNLPTIVSRLQCLHYPRIVYLPSLLVLVVLTLAPKVRGSAVFPIADTPSAEVAVSFAFDGTNYLAGFRAVSLGQHEVAAQLFSASATLIGSRVSIGYSDSLPYIAFDGARYLVIWQDSTNLARNIYGQFVTRSGSLSGPAIRITSAGGIQDLDAMKPIAYGTNKYLIVYRDSRSGTNAIYGQLVTTAGLLSAPEIAIDNGVLPAQEAAVAFAGNNFLVVWQKRTASSQYDTYGVFITPSGSKGVPFVISQTASTKHNPINLLFAGTNYLVVWNKNSGPTDFDIYGRFVASNGTFPGNEMGLVTATGPQIAPGLAFDGSKFLLSWTDGFFGSTTNVLRFQFFNSALQRIAGEFSPFSAKGTNYPFATVPLFDGRRFAALATLANVDTNFNFSSADVYGTFISKIAVSILVNGVSITGDVIVTNQASVAITSTATNGVIFYTLNGDYPGTGPFYNGPLLLTQPTTIRAIAYSPDFSDFGEASDVHLVFAYTPTALAQPPSQDRLVGQAATFSAQATGTPPLNYQWFSNGSLIDGATNSTLVISNVQLTNAGVYGVTVSNPYGSTNSPGAVLNVYALPAILTQPVGTNVFTNDAATLKVVASGSPAPQFQWRLNGVNLPGQTNAILTITNVQLANCGSYTLVVANEFGTLISAPAQLTIQVPTAPTADFFTNRVQISGVSGIVSGTNSSASKESGEPNPAQKPGGKSVWYRWVAPASGVATFSTRGSTFDTLLGAYNGSIVSNLVVQASDEDSGGNLTSEIRFNASAGVEYEIAIDGYAGAGGYFVLSWSLERTPQTVPAITQQPQSAAVLESNDALFSVSATGSGLFYHWFFNDTLIAGADGPSLLMTNVQIKDIGSYTVQISNSFGRKITSSAANLEIVSQPSSPTADKLADADASAPTNHLFGPAKGPHSLTPVGFGTVGYQFFGNLHSGTDPIDPAHCAIGGSSRWLKLVAGIDGTMSIDTITSQVYTVIAVYRGGDPSDITSANLIKCDVNSAPDGHSLVQFQAQTGVTNSILVDGTNGATGLIFLHYCLGAAPTIGTEIGMPPVREGDPLSLAPSMSPGTPPPSYQWYRDSQPILLANGPTYFIDHAQATDAGVYSLVVSNCLGVSSNIVSRITIDIPLTIGYTGSSVGGQWQFRLTGSINHDITLQGTTNFLNWIPLWTNRPPALLNYLDPLSATLPWRFYRAIPWP